LATGAQVLTLLTTLRDHGWFRFLAEPRDLDTLAEFSGLPPTRWRTSLPCSVSTASSSSRTEACG
jgi:hypothetical protein